MSYIEGTPNSVVSALQEKLEKALSRSEQLEQELRKNSDVLGYYRQAVDNSPNAIFSIDRTGYITTWNPSCTRIFRYNLSVLGGHFRKLLCWQSDIEFIEKNLLHSPKAKTLTNLDLHYQCSTGEIREMVSRIYPVECPNGEVVGFVFANTDVTERNKTHRELDRYRHHLEKLVDERTTNLKKEIAERKNAQIKLQKSYDSVLTILDGMDLAIRVTSYSSGVIIFLNNRLKKLQEEGEKIQSGYSLFDEIATDNNNLVETAEKQTLSGEESDWSTPKLDTITGRWFIFRQTFIPWLDGRVVCLQVATDITERKKIDEERKRVEKLESLGVFAGGIAHDFNNLLTGIMGNLSLLKIQLDDKIPGYRLLESAEQAASRATSLTQQLLTFSKGGDPVPDIIDVSEVIREAVQFSLSGSAVRSVMDIAESLMPIEADAGQISQVFHNLVINAKQVMTDGGILSVSAKNCTFGAHQQDNFPAGDYIQITFSDTGPGIEPAIRDKIFDPYFSTKAKGEGLGLATAFTIIAKHGGHISIDPQAGVGATFRILLPATLKEIQEPSGFQSCPGVRKGRILLMDDEEMIRDVATAILHHLGYEVDSVSDGDNALRKYGEADKSGNAYDAVILDLTIPGGMGGEKTAEALRRVNPAAKIIASSGYSDSATMSKSDRFGFASVLKKPYKVEEIAEVLDRLLKSDG